MELVINVSEEDYKTLMNINDDRLPSIIARKHLYNAVANGTPLPKGHGKLVDVNSVQKKDRDIIVKTVLRPRETGFAITLEEYVNNLPTIIEADREEQE